MEQNFNPMIMHDPDEDETLSLCDLRIYGVPDNYSLEDQNRSSSSSDGQLVDHFEFFTEEWIAAASSYSTPAENILFCGKLIPYKQNLDNGLKLKSNKQRKRTRHGVLNWSLKSKTSKSKGRKGKCPSKNASGLPYSSSFQSLHPSKQCVSRHGSCGKESDILGQRITILKSRTKSKWFLFFFGMGRVPTEMEMREVRKRQNKKNKSPRSSGGGKKSGKSKGKGWWKLIRAFGCSGYHHADAVIKASYGCAPLARE